MGGPRRSGRTPYEDERAHAEAFLAALRQRLAPTRCMTCWMTRAHCLCSRLARLRVRTARVDVLVSVHYKEFGKATNTAKLLPQLLSTADGSGDSCSLCVYPNDPFHERLPSGPTLLLWPGEGSMPAADLRDWVAAQQQRVTLLVIDGTWGHARAMARHVPKDVVRVHVNDEVAGPSLFLNRRQATADRVSTVEAVALALAALGETADLSPLGAALKLQVDVALAQQGRPPAFGSELRPDPRLLACPHSPKTAPLVDRPAVCPLCDAADATFKNVRFWPTAPGRVSRLWRCRRCNGMFSRDEPAPAVADADAATDAPPAADAGVVVSRSDSTSPPAAGAAAVTSPGPAALDRLIRSWQRSRVLCGHGSVADLGPEMFICAPRAEHR